MDEAKPARGFTQPPSLPPHYPPSPLIHKPHSPPHSPLLSPPSTSLTPPTTTFASSSHSRISHSTRQTYYEYETEL